MELISEDILSKKCHKSGSYTQYLQSYVRKWKSTTVNCAWPSLSKHVMCLQPVSRVDAQTREELVARIMHAATEIRDNSVKLKIQEA
jgi:hypothetical protein